MAYVYRLFKGQKLLYIGRTKNLENRLIIHGRRFAFDTVTAENMTHKESVIREAALIRELLPPLNKIRKKQKKKARTLFIKTCIADEIKIMARKDGRNFSNYVEQILKKHMEKK